MDEGYPADCIAFNSLVNPDQPQYRVEGHLVAREKTEPAPASSSDLSLQLKPDKSGYSRQPQTPSRTDGSEQESLRVFLREAEARALEKERQIAERTKGKGKARDALDTAIEELRAIKDLVSLVTVRENLMLSLWTAFRSK